mmetsp:Transcript_34405/g.47025  ORF Transcript_34405/g.47025 Transcript_34405/m.47025 type:complete len:245 (-) Transcript_34405:120-854(-)
MFLQKSKKRETKKVGGRVCRHGIMEKNLQKKDKNLFQDLNKLSIHIMIPRSLLFRIMGLMERRSFKGKRRKKEKEKEKRTLNQKEIRNHTSQVGSSHQKEKEKEKKTPLLQKKLMLTQWCMISFPIRGAQSKNGLIEAPQSQREESHPLQNHLLLLLLKFQIQEEGVVLLLDLLLLVLQVQQRIVSLHFLLRTNLLLLDQQLRSFRKNKRSILDLSPLSLCLSVFFFPLSPLLPVLSGLIYLIW